MGLVGGRNENIRWASIRCWLVGQCWNVDVAILFIIFSTIFSLLLPGSLRTQGGPQRRLHSKIPTYFKGRFDKILTDIILFMKLSMNLQNFPTRYIHEPWNAPESVQRAAKCIIGREYSLPMVNHAVASRTNMERMRQVYHQLYKYRDPSKYNDFPSCSIKIISFFSEIFLYIFSYPKYSVIYSDCFKGVSTIAAG